MYSHTECGYVERAIGCGNPTLAYDDVNLQRTHTQVSPPSHHREIAERVTVILERLRSFLPPTPPPTLCTTGLGNVIRKLPPAWWPAPSLLCEPHGIFRGTDIRANPLHSPVLHLIRKELAATVPETSTGFEDKQETEAGQRDEAPPSPRHRLHGQNSHVPPTKTNTQAPYGAFLLYLLLTPANPF